MREILLAETGAEWKANNHWDGEELSGYVFSCVDSMEVRRKILESMEDGVFIETRMGVFHGQVFTIDTAKKEEKEFWLKHWYGDDVVEEKSACGTSLTLGATAQLLSSIAIWQFILHMRGESPSKGLVACVNPLTLEEIK